MASASRRARREWSEKSIAQRIVEYRVTTGSAVQKVRSPGVSAFALIRGDEEGVPVDPQRVKGQERDDTMAIANPS